MHTQVSLGGAGKASRRRPRYGTEICMQAAHEEGLACRRFAALHRRLVGHIVSLPRCKADRALTYCRFPVSR